MPSHRPFVRQKIGPANIVGNESMVLQQRYGIALQRVSCRVASRGEAGRDGTGGGRKRRTKRRKRRCLVGELDEVRRTNGVNEIATQTIQDDDDSSLQRCSPDN